ncbi:hypothetical protein PGB90_010483 [Kerria lacca]
MARHFVMVEPPSFSPLVKSIFANSFTHDSSPMIILERKQGSSWVLYNSSSQILM